MTFPLKRRQNEHLTESGPHHVWIGIEPVHCSVAHYGVMTPPLWTLLLKPNRYVQHISSSEYNLFIVRFFLQNTLMGIEIVCLAWRFKLVLKIKPSKNSYYFMKPIFVYIIWFLITMLLCYSIFILLAEFQQLPPTRRTILQRIIRYRKYN